MAATRWRLADPAPPAFLEAFVDMPPLVAQLLYNRRIRTPAQARAFLEAGEDLTGDPLALPDMGQAVGRLYRALLSGETVGLYGDFDADGVTATALLAQALTGLGGHVVPYIPHRVDEGHGLNAQALQTLADQGCTLTITVDCGITGIRDGAAPRGMDLIITDHHLPTGEIPPALAAINPHLPGCAYPYTELTGVGVAFKLTQALYDAVGRRWSEDLLELVALGTIADLGPLVGENRYLVRRGLEALAHSARPGLLALAEVARLSLPLVTAEDVGFALAPRLNAAGRMDHAMLAYRLLVSDSQEEARELAVQLEAFNIQRRELTQRLMDIALTRVHAEGPDSPFLIVGGEEFVPGVAGLVAGRLTEELYRPALVYHQTADHCRGSGRSIPGFDITGALGQCEDLLERYGGHVQAAGFLLLTANLLAFRDRLVGIAERELAGRDLTPGIDVDAETALSHLPGDVLSFFRHLAPFGQGNPVPTFLSRRLEVVDSRVLGEGKHLRLKVRENGAVWNAVAFGQGHRGAEAKGPVDIVYNLRLDNWQGEARLELGVLDFAPSI